MDINSIVVSLMLCIFSIGANAPVITFDEVPANDFVNDFYSSEGVFFQMDDWLTMSGFGNSSPFAFSASRAGFMTVNGGFTNLMTFTYGAFEDSTVNIFDGLDGSGVLLSSVVLPKNNFLVSNRLTSLP